MLAFLLLACGTQSGTEKHDTGEDPCRSSSTEVGPDEASPGGFSADEVLAWLEAGASGSLTWSAGGSTTISLGFAAAEGTPSWTDLEQNPDSAETCETPDRLYIPVSWSVVTADGAVDEDGVYVVWATNASTVHFVTTIGGYGELDPACTEGGSDPELQIEAEVTTTGTTGHLECGSAGTSIATW